MTFDAWLTKAGVTNSAFAELIGKTGETVRRYRAGEREPDFDTQAMIFRLTDGAVTPNDWVGVGLRADEAPEGGAATCEGEVG